MAEIVAVAVAGVSFVGHPNNANERNRIWDPGYTTLEKYLNSIDGF